MPHSAMTAVSEATVFENYSEEITELFKEIDSQLASAPPKVDRSSSVLLQQCQEILQQMSVEARSAESIEQRKSYMEQYQSYKKQYEALKQKVERGILVNASSDRNSTVTHSQLQSTEQRLVNQNAIVSNSLKSIHETEQIAIETMEHLHNQRNTLEHSRDNTKSLQSLTQQANQIATNLLKPWWRKGV